VAFINHPDLFPSLCLLLVLVMMLAVMLLLDTRTKSKKLLRIYAGAAIVALLLSGIAFFNGTLSIAISNIYAIAFTGFCLKWAVPQLACRRKYSMAILLYGISVIGGLISSFALTRFFLFFESMFAFLSYFMIFLLIIEWIIDRMQAVSFSSVTDGLTGLFVKDYFKKKVAEALNSGETSYLIFIDIDFFKRLNDTLGHQMGDKMLIFVADIMRHVCNDIGLVGRYGGEEIVALITEPMKDPGKIAELIRARVEKESKAIMQDEKIKGITISVGYAKSKNGITVDQYIRMADEAMYRAKTTGKNKVVNFDAMDDVLIKDNDQKSHEVILPPSAAVPGQQINKAILEVAAAEEVEKLDSVETEKEKKIKKDPNEVKQEDSPKERKIINPFE
jgi:two-component system, cell cycle response regulator